MARARRLQRASRSGGQDTSGAFRNKTWHNFGTKIDLKLIDNDQVAGFYLPGYPCEDIMDLPASVIGSTSQIN